MKRVIIAAVLVAVFFVSYQVHRNLTKPVRTADMKAEVNDAIDELHEKARRDHPGISEADVYKTVAAEQATKMLADTDETERSKSAAALYLGFYLGNTRVRKAYCDARGIDIGNFVSAFEAKHASGFARASAILNGQGVDPEQLYAVAQEQMTKAIEQDMQTVAQAAHVPLEQSCQVIADQAATIVELVVPPPSVMQALGA